MIPVITEETSSLHDAMRRLWAEDVIWTREYIVEAVAGAPDAAQAAADQDLLSQELFFTKRELDARFEEDWECDVEYFDDMFTQILTMADVLSEGLVSQFPDRFDHPGSRQAREGETNAMEIEEIPRTFSLRLTEQELTALTEVVGSWIDNSKVEDPAVETMYQQLSDALGDEAAEVPEKAAEEEAVDEETAEEEE